MNGVKLIGGFAGTETVASQSNPATNPTILDAGSARRVIVGFDLAASTVVRGFVIQNGKDDSDDGGGAIALENSAAVFVQCTFKNNSAFRFGGVVAVRGTSTPHFVNCIFQDNGTCNSNCDPITVKPLGGGAVFVHSGTATFTNCLFVNNIAGEGGVFMPLHGKAEFYNCTIAYNKALQGDGGALLAPTADVKVHNSILWGNTVPSGKSGPQIHYLDGYLPLVKYSSVQGGFQGTGNISTDPQFVNFGAGDYQLSDNSPCVNAGHNPFLPADVGNLDWDTSITESLPKDLKLNNRKVTFTVDIGAYELPFNPQ